MVVAHTGRAGENIEYDQLLLVGSRGHSELLDLREHGLQKAGSLCVSERHGHILFCAWQEGEGEAEEPMGWGIYRYEVSTGETHRMGDGRLIDLLDAQDLLAFYDSKRKSIGTMAYPSADVLGLREVAAYHFGKQIWGLAFSGSSKLLIWTIPNEREMTQLAFDLATWASAELDPDERLRPMYCPAGGMVAFLRRRVEERWGQIELQLVVEDLRTGDELATMNESVWPLGRLMDFSWGPDGCLYVKRSIHTMWDALASLTCGDMIARYDFGKGAERRAVSHAMYFDSWAPVSDALAAQVAATQALGDRSAGEDGGLSTAAAQPEQVTADRHDDPGNAP